MALVLTSYGYKHRGTPEGTDKVVPCTALRNPHTVYALKNMTGLDEPVARFIETDPLLPEIIRVAADAVRNGRTKIAFQCFGGRHRSVYCAEHFARQLREQGHEVTVRHLELS